MDALPRIARGLLGGALFLTACARQADLPTLADPPALDSAQLAERQLQVLDQVREIVRQEYVFPEFAGVEWQAQADLLARHIESGLQPEEFALALGSLTDMLPADTAVLTARAERVAGDYQYNAIYDGIGAFVSVRADPVPRILLLSVMQGSPAEAAGLRAHDAVVAVDGQPVRAEEGFGVVNRVRGPAGSEVVLQVISPDGEPREVTVQRERLVAQDFIRGGPLLPGILYLQVPVAADSTLLEATVQLLENASQQDNPVRGLILDLRIAGSAAEWPLSDMLSLLGSGNMGAFVDRREQVPMVVPGQDIANSQSIPVAILIGPDTRGAPELFAAALQARGRAQLVGLPTSGNVLSFRRQVLLDGSELSFAQSSFLTPLGEDLGLVGLSPDLPVPQDWDQVSPSNDPVLAQAVDLLLRES